MSKRQPTITLDDQIVAHDEIVAVIELQTPPAPHENQTGRRSAVKLVDGTILPLAPHKIEGVIEFLLRNEQ